MKKKTIVYMLLVWTALMLFNVPHFSRGLGYHTTVRLAASFLEGRVDVDPAPDMHDVILHQDRVYVPFPPAPALLLTPWVALFGTGAHPLWLTPLIGALAAGALFGLYRRVSGNERLSLWLSAAMIFGTAYWPCVRYAFDTYLAHCLAVFFTAFAFLEAFGRRRGWLIGLCLGLSCLSRQLTVFNIPFVMALLWFGREGDRPDMRARLCSLGGAGAMLALALGGLLLYNHARFGSPLESGYAWVMEDEWYGLRLQRWGNFHWAYLPSNLLRMFALGFTIEFEPPLYMKPVMGAWGTSLTFASPFLFFALRGRLPACRAVNMVGWGCIAVTLLAVLLHKSAGGGWQINGMRYALDFLPLLSLFALTGMQRAEAAAPGRLARAAMLYAVALNLLAIVITHARHFFPS